MPIFSHQGLLLRHSAVSSTAIKIKPVLSHLTASTYRPLRRRIRRRHERASSKNKQSYIGIAESRLCGAWSCYLLQPTAPGRSSMKTHLSTFTIKNNTNQTPEGPWQHSSDPLCNGPSRAGSKAYLIALLLDKVSMEKEKRERKMKEDGRRTR